MAAHMVAFVTRVTEQQVVRVTGIEAQAACLTVDALPWAETGSCRQYL